MVHTRPPQKIGALAKREMGLAYLMLLPTFFIEPVANGLALSLLCW